MSGMLAMRGIMSLQKDVIILGFFHHKSDLKPYTCTADNKTIRYKCSYNKVSFCFAFSKLHNQ